jgi:starch synthase
VARSSTPKGAAPRGKAKTKKSGKRQEKEARVPTQQEHGPRVLHVATELFPWVKTGGLGDVMAALPPALNAIGVEARLVLPGFTALLDALPLTDVARLRTPFAGERVRLSLARLPETGQPVYLLDHPAFYDRPGGPYSAPDGGEWGDNFRRFALLGWAAAAIAEGADPKWRPQIVHGHDWHAGLAPAYLKAVGSPVPSVFTVHNLAYQGFFGADIFGQLALPPHFFSINGVEYFGGLSFMKAGLFYADRLTTVSPTYAEEIQTPDFGMNLDGLLRTRSAVLSGILNGVDAQIWSPDADRILPRPYGIDDAGAGKAAAKAELQGRFGLDLAPDIPLFGAVTRLTWQKGIDLLLAALPGLVSLGGQLALLGSGESELERGFAGAAASIPGKIAAMIGYDEALAHLIIAASDVVLVPSRFEPCGLTQLYGLRYGALPLVRRTGGLADTVADTNAMTLAEGTATGFVFEDGFVEALVHAIQRAIALYPDKTGWNRVMRQAMTRDFSWDAAAKEYAALYQVCLQTQPR